MSLRDGGSGREIDEEIRHHLDELVDLLVDEGWEPGAARREAERRFGDVARIRGELSGVHGTGGVGSWLRSVAADVRYGVRALRKRPTFTLSVVATLALGLGAAASIFAVVDALMLRPLPYADAERWMEVARASEDGGSYYYGMNKDRLAAWQRALEGVADGWVGFMPTQFVRTDGPEAQALSAVVVTPGAAALLGIPLRLGRGFTPDDALPGAPPVAVLTNAYWVRTGGDPDILGRTLRTEVGNLTVVGVLRGDVHFPVFGPERDVWVPIRSDLTWADRSLSAFGNVWARRAPGVDAAAAQGRADVLAAGLAERNPSKEGWRVRLVQVGEHRANPDTRQALWTLCATVAAIFLIALVNGINLTLVRASARLREVAVRLAIGGSRLRLLRPFLVEGALLGALGGVASVLFGVAALAVLRGRLPRGLVWFSPHAFTLETRTALFVAGAALLAGLALGLLPAARALSGMDPATALGGRTHDDHRGAARLRSGLVVLQVALTATLLVVAGLLTRSIVRLTGEDPGYDAGHVAIGTVQPSSVRYPDAEARWAFVRALEETLERRPEIDAVTVVSDDGLSFGALQAEGAEPVAGGMTVIPNAVVAPDYLSVTGTRLVEGRALDAGDDGTKNVLVDRDLARYLWPDASPLGRRFRIDTDPWMTVVGVVRDLRLMGRDQRQGPNQFLSARKTGVGGSYLEFMMHTPRDPETLPGIFRAAVRSQDPEQWIVSARTADDALAEDEQTARFLVVVMALLATIATALSAVGLYGVLSYSVACRQRELGIRMALGADRGRVRGRVMGDGIVVAGIGLTLGLGGALALSGLLARLLYRLEPVDPVTYVGVAVGMLVIAVLASSLPARHATRVDPAEVLRAD